MQHSQSIYRTPGLNALLTRGHWKSWMSSSSQHERPPGGVGGGDGNNTNRGLSRSGSMDGNALQNSQYSFSSTGAAAAGRHHDVIEVVMMRIDRVVGDVVAVAAMAAAIDVVRYHHRLPLPDDDTTIQTVGQLVLFVGNLSPKCHARDIRAHFGSCGQIVDVHFPLHPTTRECKGYCR